MNRDGLLSCRTLRHRAESTERRHAESTGTRAGTERRSHVHRTEGTARTEGGRVAEQAGPGAETARLGSRVTEQGRCARAERKPSGRSTDPTTGCSVRSQPECCRGRLVEGVAEKRVSCRGVRVRTEPKRGRTRGRTLPERGAPERPERVGRLRPKQRRSGRARLRVRAEAEAGRGGLSAQRPERTGSRSSRASARTRKQSTLLGGRVLRAKSTERRLAEGVGRWGGCLSEQSAGRTGRTERRFVRAQPSAQRGRGRLRKAKAGRGSGRRCAAERLSERAARSGAEGGCCRCAERVGRRTEQPARGWLGLILSEQPGRLRSARATEQPGRLCAGSEQTPGTRCARLWSLPVGGIVFESQLLDGFVFVILHERNTVLLRVDGGRLPILNQRIRAVGLLILGHRRAIATDDARYGSRTESRLCRAEQSPGSLCVLPEEARRGRVVRRGLPEQGCRLGSGLAKPTESGRFGRTERGVVVVAKQGRIGGGIVLRPEQ